MPPKSDSSSEIQVVNSGGDSEIKLPFKTRMIIRLTNLIQSTRLFIYNKDHLTFFGNTSSGWIKLSIYYFFFYVCLGLFYSGMVAVFGAIISRESPTYWYHNSVMNDNGKFYIGMGFRPMPDIGKTSITVYNNTASQNDTVSSIRTYQYAYLTQYDTTYLDECSPTQPSSKLAASYSCKFSWTDIVTSETHPCSETNLYGWSAGQPCILIKLNQIYGWTPDSGSVVSQVAAATGQPVLSVDEREDNIYITCNPKNPNDKTAMGAMVYYSILHPLGNANYGGIPYYFFPYMNSNDFVQPFVLVQFTALTLDQTFNIECRTWAPNIQQLSQGTTMRGMVAFSLLRSSATSPPKS